MTLKEGTYTLTAPASSGSYSRVLSAGEEVPEPYREHVPEKDLDRFESAPKDAAKPKKSSK